MERLEISATRSTPHVIFDPEQGVMSMKGDAYPENAASFFRPVLDWFKNLTQV